MVAVVCGWVAYAVYSEADQGRALDARVAQLRQQNAVLQQQVDERRREIAEAQSQAWLEEQARKLGYVMPGEKVYVITGGNAPATGGGVDYKLPTWSPSPTPAPTPQPTPSPTGPPRLVLP